MNPATEEAIKNRMPEIEVTGSELSETLARLEANNCFVQAVDVINISGYRLKVHHPAIATGELPLDNPPADQHEQS